MSVFVVILMINELIFPVYTYGLTGGPSQPEVQSFEPVGTSQMVDLATGDFNYNIPLFDVGGYPVNIAYHAGGGMDEEASWVGYGWNINPGVINRSLRGLPDDFNGDEIKTEYHIKPNRTLGLNYSPNVELFGIKLKKNGPWDLKLNLGIFYNNYKGVGYEYSASPSFSKGHTTSMTTSLSIGTNSQTGTTITPSVSFGMTMSGKEDEIQKGSKFKIGSSYNSRGGVQSLNFGVTRYTTKQYSKNDKVNSSGSTNSSHNFTATTYVPNVSNSQRTFHISMNAAIGSGIQGVYPDQEFSGYYSSQWLKESTNSKKAYGYCYEQNTNEEDVLFDFNRERDGAYNENTQNLPLTNHTYDIYSASGQGISGSFRAFRSDVPMLHSDVSRTTSEGGSLGGEFGPGAMGHFGANVNVNWNNSETGAWDDNNYLVYSYGHLDGDPAPLYEPFYFKSAGESTKMDKQYYRAIAGDTTVAPFLLYNYLDNALYKKVPEIKTSLMSIQYPSHRKELSAKVNNVRSARESRNTVMSVLDARQAEVGALDKNITEYVPSWNYDQSDGFDAINAAERLSKPTHHFSEISVLNNEGARYIYGIPAYNNFELEKTFNVRGRYRNCGNGQITYDPTGSHPDNSLKNDRGNDNFYSSKITPEYAHSYLLTGYLSPDYVDLHEDGITDDDLGTAVKFNYSKPHSEYKWRVPYNTNSANYQEGLNTTKEDDKGSYVYGTKEMWYMHSIETKTQVAVFILSDRNDGLGVLGENGGKDVNQKLKKLDKIIVYEKQDFIRNGNSAIPVKTVHFDYDYSLCQGIDNSSSDQGKLTLKRIYFTYGKSNKGVLSAYEFNYGYDLPAYNPSYNLKGSDCWGSYKPNPSATCAYNDQEVSNAVFPYTVQDSATAALHASAWALTKIKLPSGGTINITYEADDYAYVQNRQAMQLFQIKGFGNTSTLGTYTNKIYNKDGLYNINHSDVVYFKLKEPITGSNAAQKLLDRYINGITDVQFTVFAKIRNDDYEYVKGYMELDLTQGYGVVDGGNTGYVGLKKVSMGDKHPMHSNRMVNPIARTIWNYSRLNLPHLVNPYSNDDAKDLKFQLFGLMPLIADLRSMVEGYNKTLEDRNFGESVIVNKSWIRFNVPDKKKYGGGHRVKKITTSDNWSIMGAGNTSVSDFEYGQEYHYNKEEKQANGETLMISSGVAAYEPLLGGDENPFRQPLVIKKENLMAPDEQYMTEGQVGESFFPAASVVYSKVTVNALKHEDVKRTATGYSVNEFVTAYDYPTIVDQTEINKYIVEPPPFWSLFNIQKLNKANATQGYKIELNDMHGKPKSEFSYSEESTTPLAGKVYYYKTKTEKGVNKLDNKVLTINPQGVISENEISIEADFSVDTRKSVSNSYSGGVQMNVEIIAALIIPVVLPSIYPNFSAEKLEFRSGVTTKVIKKYGILDKTVVFKNGATLESQNLLYDEETGDVLLSKTQNEFNDYNYSYTYPAYWGHKGMGPAYKNVGAVIKNVSINSYGDISMASPHVIGNYLYPGDECLVSGNNGTGKYLMAYVYDGADGILNLIDKNGDPIYPGAGSYYNDPGTGPFEIKVVRSARRNMIAADMGTITTRTNPLVNSGGNYSLTFTNVLDASAMQYKDEWQTYVPYLNEYKCVTNQVATDYFNLAKCIVSKSKLDQRLSFNLVSLTENTGDSLYIKVNNTWLGYSSPFYFELNVNFDCDSIYFVKSAPGIRLKVNLINERELKSFGLKIVPVNSSDNLYHCQVSNLFSNCGEGSCLNSFYSSELKRVFDSIGNADLDTFDVPVSWFEGYSLNTEYQINETNPKTISYKIGLINEDPGDGVYLFDCQLEFNIPMHNFIAIDSLLSFTPISKNSAMLKMRIERFCHQFDTIEVLAQFPCFNSFNCQYECFSAFTERSVNPYRSGLEGNWRPYKNRTYLEDRLYSSPLNVRTDGTYQSYTPFWSYNATTKVYEPSTNAKWVWANEITKYTPFGNEVENKDALNRYSAAVFGYSHTLPKAVASNAKYGQIAYDGFEDYSYLNPYNVSICDVDHWSFKNMFNPTLNNAELDNVVKHTGRYSLKVLANKSVEVTRNVVLDNFDELSFDYNRVRTIKENDDIGLFKPEPGKYVISAWVKENSPADDTLYSDAKIEVVLINNLGSSTTHTFKAKGKVIEGWQRIEGEFSYVSGDNIKAIKIKLVGATEIESWFDDIRIHPFNGNLKSYAYDARNMRLMAELDENNYATFYEYDVEGILIRVKKETIEGISTLKENRNHYFKTPQ